MTNHLEAGAVISDRAALPRHPIFRCPAFVEIFYENRRHSDPKYLGEAAVLPYLMYAMIAAAILLALPVRLSAQTNAPALAPDLATNPTAPHLDPHVPDSGDYRVRRGGSWYDSINLLRCAARQQLDPWMAAPNIGLRCVRKPE